MAPNPTPSIPDTEGQIRSREYIFSAEETAALASKEFRTYYWVLYGIVLCVVALPIALLLRNQTITIVLAVAYVLCAYPIVRYYEYEYKRKLSRSFEKFDNLPCTVAFDEKCYYAKMGDDTLTQLAYSKMYKAVKSDDAFCLVIQRKIFIAVPFNIFSRQSEIDQISKFLVDAKILKPKTIFFIW